MTSDAVARVHSSENKYGDSEPESAQNDDVGGLTTVGTANDVEQATTWNKQKLNCGGPSTAATKSVAFGRDDDRIGVGSRDDDGGGMRMVAA
jgi:hypothetical protein